MRLKKRFVLFLIIILIIWAVPHFTGQYFEMRYHKLLAAISEFEGVSLSSVTYDRGWRKASATTKIKVTNPGLGPLKLLVMGAQQPLAKSSYQVTLKHKIWHGPFINLKGFSLSGWFTGQAYIESELLLDQNLQQLLQQTTQNKKLLSVTTNVDIMGNVNITLDGKDLKLVEDNSHLIFKGLKGRWQITEGLTALEGYLDMPGFELKRNNDFYLWEDLSLKAKRNFFKESWIGKMLFKAKAVKSAQAGDSVVTLNDLAFGKVVEAFNETLSIDNTVTLKTFTYDGSTYGPLSFKVTANRLPIVIYRFLKKLSTQKLEGYNGMTVLAKVTEKMPQMIAAFPEVVVHSINIPSSAGKIEGKIQMGFDRDAVDMIASGDDVSKTLLIQARLSMPHKAYKQMIQYLIESDILPLGDKDKVIYVESLARKWLKEGYLEDKGGWVELDMVVQNGLMLFNGVEKTGDSFWRLPAVITDVAH